MKMKRVSEVSEIAEKKSIRNMTEVYIWSHSFWRVDRSKIEVNIKLAFYQMKFGRLWSDCSSEIMYLVPLVRSCAASSV